MSNERSRDANQLLEDIELELASIRAAMALRSVDRPSPPPGPNSPKVDAMGPAARVIGTVDLARTRQEASAAPAPSASEPEPQPHAPRRLSLQERLASLTGKD